MSSRNQKPRTRPATAELEVLLAGGGHAHVEVLRRWSMRPIAGVRLTVVVDQTASVYSGMVPGVIAGQYGRRQATNDIAGLAARAGAKLVVDRVVRVEPRSNRLQLAGGASLAYDAASLNLGSAARTDAAFGVPAHAVPTRPIAAFIERLERVFADPQLWRRPRRVVIVGAGAAGLELAFAVAARLRAGADAGAGHAVTVLGDAPTPLPGASGRSARLVFEALARHRLTFRGNTRVTQVDATSLTTEAGDVVPSDLTIWAAGPAPPPVVRDSELPHDAQGFVLTNETLLVQGSSNLFAVGDCATLATEPHRARAGVYAVRAGPVLYTNLRRWVNDRPLRAYRPQKQFLRLLTLSDGTAIGLKWGVAFEGKAVYWLKDQIDRRFVSRFTLNHLTGDKAESEAG